MLTQRQQQKPLRLKQRLATLQRKLMPWPRRTPKPRLSQVGPQGAPQVQGAAALGAVALGAAAQAAAPLQGVVPQAAVLQGVVALAVVHHLVGVDPLAALAGVARAAEVLLAADVAAHRAAAVVVLLGVVEGQGLRLRYLLLPPHPLTNSCRPLRVTVALKHGGTSSTVENVLQSYLVFFILNCTCSIKAVA